MALSYTLYHYDCSRRSVVMTDMDGKELVIDCERAEEQVVFDEPEDKGILVRLAREEPASYMSLLCVLADYRIMWMCGMS